jgi:NAD(P)-dependent dehydrogenase (short-subunit alcohol dehydrogenase family)
MFLVLYDFKKRVPRNRHKEQQVKLTIFAATGGIGRQLLEQATDAGHDVTAVVRNPGRLSRPVRTVTADLTAAGPAALEPALAGADAVLSGLGPRSNADAGVAAQGTRAIVAALQATGVRRIIAVSAAPAGTVPTPARPRPPRHDPGDGFFCVTCSVTWPGRRSAGSSPTWRRWRTSWPPAAWTGPWSGRPG